MFEQSKPYPDLIQLVARVKARHRLKAAVVSNESREVNACRIRKFKLDELADSFISSCFVHLRKPDSEILRLALDNSPGGRKPGALHRKHADVRPGSRTYNRRLKDSTAAFKGRLQWTRSPSPL